MTPISFEWKSRFGTIYSLAELLIDSIQFSPDWYTRVPSWQQMLSWNLCLAALLCCAEDRGSSKAFNAGFDLGYDTGFDDGLYACNAYSVTNS